MKRSNLALVFYLSIVFLSGLLTGGLGGRVSCPKPVAAEPAPRLTPDEYRRQYVERMTNRLHLTSEQLQTLEQILDKTRARFHDIRQQQTDDINAMLSPEQQVEYAAYRKEREELRKREEEQQRLQQQQRQKQSR
jgi:hypothetical protein